MHRHLSSPGTLPRFLTSAYQLKPWPGLLNEVLMTHSCLRTFRDKNFG